MANKYLTAVGLTCQLYCLNKPSWMVGFLLYLPLLQPRGFGADGLSRILQFILEPLKPLFLADYREKQQPGFTKSWSPRCSEAQCADLAPGREQLSSGERWEFSFPVPSPWPSHRVPRHCGREELAFTSKLNQKPSLETCWYQSYGSARAGLEKGATLSNI